MANNKFDIKVFTDELNKAFTILKKEQVLEKYMKNILLNYNSIIYIGNITDEPNKYNTIYNYMYGEDNTLCNIVIFETDGFVDSESNIIPSGIHISYPYLDYSVCIDYKYILNINNSAELLTPTQEYKTINNESILGEGNIPVQEPLVSGTNIKTVNEQSLVGAGNISVQEPLVSGSNIKTVNGQTILGSGNVPVQEPLVSGTNIKTVNEQSLVGAGNISVQEPLVSGSNIKTVNGNSLLGSGNIDISGGGESDTITIDLGEIKNTGTLSPTILSKINNAISENKNIVIKGKYKDEDIIYTNISYEAGRMLYATGITFSNSLTGNAPTITIDLSSGQYFPNPISFQRELISGNNIKTINGQTILGNGNIEISDSKICILESLSNSGTLATDKVQELLILIEKMQLIQVFFIYNNGSYITANAYVDDTTSTLNIIAYDVSNSLNAVNLSIDVTNGNYTITTIEISGGESNNTIKIIECSPGAQLDADKLQKLQSGKYALYITGTMFYPTSDTKRFNTVPYFNYFGTYIQMCYKSVAINQSNYLETISTYSIDLDIKKTTE